MNHKKIQTTVQANGDTSVTELGWVSTENLDRDMDRERQRFSAIARTGRSIYKDIQTVETTTTSVVVIYESGTVRVINYVPEGA